MKSALHKAGLVLLLLLSTALLVSPAVFIGVASSGCAILDKSADPVVVRAEQVQEVSLAIIVGYCEHEKANRDELWKVSHSFKEIGDQLRTKGKFALDALGSATKAYKKNRTPENKANLLTALAVVESLVQTAQQYQALAVSNP